MPMGSPPASQQIRKAHEAQAHGEIQQENAVESRRPAPCPPVRRSAPPMHMMVIKYPLSGIPFRRAAWGLPPMARISRPQRVYFMTNQNRTRSTKREDQSKMDARAEEGWQARRGNKVGRLDRVHGGMPETEDQEADDLGRDGVQQQGGDGFVDQADGFEITGDERPERAAQHAKQDHQRQ